MLLVGAFAVSKSDASLRQSVTTRQVETGCLRRRNYLAVSLPHQDSRAVRLLFVKLKHIGDALLLTPTLTAVRAAYPQAEIWVVVRKGTEGILAGCPAIDRLLTAAPAETAKRSLWNWADDFKLVPELRRQKFHHAFELSDGGRGRWLCWLSTAKNRTANVSRQPLNFWWRGKFNSPSHYNWRFGHRVEKDYFTVNDCLPLPSKIPPLVFDRSRTAPSEIQSRLSSYAVLHPGTRWQRKRWPQEKWIELGHQLLERLPQLVISAGPDSEEVEQAAAMAVALGPQALSTEGKLSWAQLAELLYGAKLFVGVDTAAMHLAAACQCPTVAIFGPSTISRWHPWQVRHELVSPPGDVPRERRMEDISADRVMAACRRVLEKSLAPSDDRHPCEINGEAH